MDRYSSTTIFHISLLLAILYILHFFFSKKFSILYTHIRSKATPCVVRPTSRRMLCRLFETLHRQLNMQSTHTRSKRTTTAAASATASTTTFIAWATARRPSSSLTCISTAAAAAPQHRSISAAALHTSPTLYSKRKSCSYIVLYKKKFKITALNFFFLHLLIQFWSIFYVGNI